MTRTEQKMLSIWIFVAIVLAAFGLIVLGMGFYYRFVQPPAPEPVLSELNPSLWWGAVMVGFAAVMLVLDRLFASKD
jgi:hypothetical protein